MNLGLKYCQAQKVIMLSADTVVPPTWLQALLKPFENDPMVKCTHAAMVIPGDPGYEEDLAKRVTPARAAYHDMSSFGLIEPHWVDTSAPPIPTLHIAGANTALDISILKELGGYMMDGDFFLDCDEIDLGFRVNSAGYKVLAVPAAAYFHRHPFNTAAKLTSKSARRLLRLQRNKALVFYKNLHTLEWIAILPIYFFGGAMKPLVYARRYPLPRLVMMVLGLELFIWLGFLNAATKYFPKFAWKRKLSLQNRRQPPFWFFKQLTARRALENLND
jgi:GT2 family glycosyltransferase